MATTVTVLCSPTRISPPSTPKQSISSSLSPPHIHILQPPQTRTQIRIPPIIRDPISLAGLVGMGMVLSSLVEPASATELTLLNSLQLSEPSNALSLPTWAVHVSSVVEWITAMALVWQYGEKYGIESWKGLSWGMVPLLGGAFCACTYHFFYNADSLEVLVALQAALTVIGNTTMCIAAFRINKSCEERTKEP